MARDDPVVLVVEDEPPLLDIYSSWLQNLYEVRTAGSGGEALEQFDDDVDVVLLDRLMPGLSGDEVLGELRDRGADVQIAMVTAVEPDFDIIDMGVDAYLTKPVKRDTVLELVEQLLKRREFADLETEYYRLVAERATLKDTKDESTLRDSDAFAELERRIESLRERIEADHDVTDEAFVSLVREIEAEDRSAEAGTNGRETRTGVGSGTDSLGNGTRDDV